MKMNIDYTNANVMQNALQSLGFYAEIADYPAKKDYQNSDGSNRLEFYGPVLLTDANETEFFTLWDSGYIDESQYIEKYEPTERLYDDAGWDWRGPQYLLMPHVYDGSKRDTIHCAFSSFYFVDAIISQLPKYDFGKVLCFYSNGDFPQFSNFYPTEIKIETYCGNEIEKVEKWASVEHYFQYQKALEFDPDGEVLKQMSNDLSCKEIKALGRKVQNFNATVWNIRRRFHMREAIAWKFYQNYDLRELLLSTDDALLAEASPRDTFWGIGYSKSNPKAFDPAQWRGKNVLGNMLMYLRNELRFGLSSEQES